MNQELYVYKITGRRTGEILGIGTSSELVEQGLYRDTKSIGCAYRWSKTHPEARRTVERVATLTPLRPKRRAANDAQPLDEDVHKLELLNAERRQQGKTALTYGHWKAGMHN